MKVRSIIDIYLDYLIILGNEGSNDLSGEQATGSPFGDGSDPVDPFLALMNEESKRLQSKDIMNEIV